MLLGAGFRILDGEDEAGAVNMASRDGGFLADLDRFLTGD